jgi:hypothetical protein
MFLSGILVGVVSTYAVSGLLGLLLATQIKTFRVRE